MFELPPNIPVISDCAEAVHIGWQETENCLLNLGFTYATPSTSLTDIEIDYLTTIGLLHGEAFENAIPKGDCNRELNVKVLGVDATLEFQELDGPFLMVGFNNGIPKANEEIHRVLISDKYGIATILDGPDATSLMFWGHDDWIFFDSIYEGWDGKSVTRDGTKFVRKVEYNDFNEPTGIMGIYYSLFPLAYPDQASWNIQQVNQQEFEKHAGRPSKLVFIASYDVTRKY